MALETLIYPGSSSFFPGQTPFGIYDDDYVFQEEAPRVALWCARRLGYPIQNIELIDENFYACLEESVSEYGAQVNQFNIRNNLDSLKGKLKTTNLTNKLVQGSNTGKIYDIVSEVDGVLGNVQRVVYKELTGTFTKASVHTEVYAEAPATTTASAGTSATFNVGRGTAYSVAIATAGTGYTQNETFTVAGNLLGGATPANDATITITTVDGGGAITAVTIAGMGGFNSMHALSTRNESPETASRPFDATRDGFVLGEGAGALVLEEYEHAIARGAKIYCEVGGGGLSSDAYHLTAPHPEGIGVIAVMQNCLRDAGLQPEDVDHINTHGTSTPLGDVAELKAISHVFGDHAKNININSTKSMTGHLLGAAGAIEAIASILAMQHSLVPPTINHTTVDENFNPSLNLTLNHAQKREIKVAMSNTFGFGGHNACVLFKKFEN